MAEELDIRSIWNKGKEKEDPSSIHINMMEKKGTKTTLYWIKIILWIEFWLTVVGVPFMFYLTIQRGDSIGLVVLYSIICTGYLFYYQFLIRQIRKFNYDGNVLQSLKKVYGYLWFYLLHYKVVIWLSLVIGLIIGFFDPQNQEGLEMITTTAQWLKFFGFIALFTGLIGGTAHLLIHLIYGRKIKRLKRMVKDLEREE